MMPAYFKAFPKKFLIENKSTKSGNKQKIKMVLNKIQISDHDLTELKNINPEEAVKVMIKSADDDTSIEDIEKVRKENKDDKYKIL